MITIHPLQLDIPQMTEQQWQDLLDVRTKLSQEFRPDEPVSSHENQRQSLSKIPELQDHVIFWLLYDDHANCVGFCILQHPKPENPDYDANKHRIYVEPAVLAPYRRQGVGKQLLPLIVNYAQKMGASWIQWDTNFEGGIHFSEKIGAIEAGRQQTNRLTVEQVDWELMQRWADGGRSRNPDVELLRFVNLPETGWIEPFCDLVTVINHNQPKDMVEGMHFTLTPQALIKEAQRLEEQKIERVIFCARTTDNTLLGMTDMFYKKTEPTHASVRLTGVQREFQERGLGKYLKAAMMLDMRTYYPDVEVVNTENFNSNGPMLSINERMGFELSEQYVFYKISVRDLAAFISE